MQIKTFDVIGLGNTLMDMLIEVDEEKFLEFDLKKGEMHLVDGEKAKQVLSKIQTANLDIKKIPGGCSANTLKGVAFLGGNAILCGKVGNDEQGEIYVQEIANHKVVPRINKHPVISTGHAISLITPDTERTFSTYLGAAITLAKEDVLEEDIEKSKVLHLEGYQVEGATRETISHAINFAKKHDTLVSIDLADPFIIRNNIDFLKDLVMNHADIVFVNEKEALEITGLSNEEEAVRKLGKHAKVAIVKLGKQGSLIYSEDNLVKINPVFANAVDTTGAGDTFAAGFLYGYCQGWNLEKCGNLGSYMAAKIVEKIGVRITELDIEEIKGRFFEEEEEEIFEKDVSKKEVENRMVKVGIIGGSGLDNPNILQDSQDIEVETVYGKPSSPLKQGKINGIDVVLLARHGRQHTIPPTKVNNQANIQALKEAGCTHILATTACGSLREEIGRGDFIILDQFIDFTRHRKISFFESFKPGDMKHTPMAEPFSVELRNMMIKTCQELNFKHHSKGTMITIEGPRFSTKAESHMFRSWGADVINMSTAPEAALANEAGIPYAAVAMSTDYDCWKNDEEPVTWEAILEVFAQNVEKVTNLLINTIPKIGGNKMDNNVETTTVTNETKTNFENPSIGSPVAENNVTNDKISFIKSKIKTYPNWPKEGIMFRDINSLFRDEEGFRALVELLVDRYKDMNIDIIAGIESRGFITGSILADRLNKKFVLIRKPGKLPGEIVGQEYTLEYGTDKVEIQKEAIPPGSKVLLVDDLIATGGTALAAAQLIKQLGGDVVECNFVIDLPDIGGKQKLLDNGFKVFNLIEFEGD